MKTAKLGAIFLISIMALAGTSAGYALWWDELYIDGYVETGYIDAEWSIEAWGDDEIAGKDFSYVDPYIIGDTLYIDIDNAYPCITYYVDFNVENTGSIPIHLYFDWTPPAGFPGTVTITDLTCLQVHPGFCEYGTIEVHLDNTAPQGGIITFSATLVYHQYNEDYPPVQP